MSEVDGNLRSKKSPELFLCGEVLNVDGECGGYNLQWAFASAVRVAEEILREAKA
jgi:predicted flavoprotein YhiN